ncbi:hypothetical protein LPJ53_004580 [Coemansia erecta]|uniref:Uncharacterized protein n=1 Tax=Coemansia erecta TaxID=147472 RepID=A0A9W8CQR8_9FUNG|nr:hypothetical protein LPJ53_004580 [Coemansia erecta]
MNENHRTAQSESLKQSARTKLTETYHKQKSATATAAAKRKTALSEQTPSSLNQSSANGGMQGAADKDAKKTTKVDIPVSLDIDPFSADGFTSPQTALDKMLSAKDGRVKADDIMSPDHSRQIGVMGSQTLNENDASALAAMRVLVKKSETDLLTLKHQLLETKAELKAAEDRLREKDALIKDQEARIDDLIESRVPMDDMNDVMDENARLRQELKDNEALLAECQKLLEEYVGDK